MGADRGGKIAASYPSRASDAKSGDPLPKLDLAGPTIDEDIRRLVRRYGEQAVRDAIKRQSRRKLGRPQEKDWLKIGDVLREDAIAWLEGKAPGNLRTNHFIALRLAEQHPGQSLGSTLRRLMRKLAADREYYTLVDAESVARNQYSCATYLKVLKALVGTGTQPVLWERYLQHAESCISDYTQKFGAPPEGLTMDQVEAGSAKLLVPPLASGPANVLQILDGTYK